MGFDEVHARRLISYLVHELSGLVVLALKIGTTFQKAYVFGAMSAKKMPSWRLCWARWRLDRAR